MDNLGLVLFSECKPTDYDKYMSNTVLNLPAIQPAPQVLSS